MKTTLEILNLSTEFLKNRQISNPRRVAEEFLAHILKLKRIDLYLKFDQPILEKELEVMRALLKRASSGEPLEYVLGEVEFFGAKIKIDSRCLIPRPETEILVDMISKENPKGVLWDICTGSGCIGISLKKKHPELNVTLSDISEDALFLARSNAVLNGVEVETLLGDLFFPFEGRKADIIVSNPPYISKNEYVDLDPSVKNFEPEFALIGGESGLEFYERFQKEIKNYLNPNGKVYFEIGYNQKEALIKLFPDAKILSDWSNHPRFLLID